MEAFLRSRGYNYLWHVLPIKNLDSILQTKMLYTEHDRHKNRIQAGGAYSISVLDLINLGEFVRANIQVSI